MDFRCHLCNKLFNGTKTLKEHLEKINHNESKVKSFPCPHCTKSYESQGVLNKHIKNSHGAPQFECERCNKKFTNKATFTRHIKFANCTADRQSPAKRTLDSSESEYEDIEEFNSKNRVRDQSKRNTRLAKQENNRDTCDRCYHNLQICVPQADGMKCKQCQQAGYVCRPLQTDTSGVAPPPKKRKRTTQGNTLQYKCAPCFKSFRLCDAEIPANPAAPCTFCKANDRYCIPQDQRQRERTQSKCRECTRRNKRCDRKHPCDQCLNDGAGRCSYYNENNDRLHNIIISPTEPIQDSNNGSRTLDLYIEDDVRCIACREVGRTCTMTTDGPPCFYCMTKTRANTNRCVFFFNTCESVSIDTRRYQIKEDDDGYEIVVFNENSKPPARTHKTRRNSNEGNISDLFSTDTEEDEPSHVSSSKERLESFRNKDNTALLADSMLLALSSFGLTTNKATSPVPTSYIQAISGPEATEWRKAIQLEYDSLIENNTWKVVNLPPNRKPLTTKWVLKKKLGPHGQLLKHKARLVARGFQQREGFDFTETYSGVVKDASYRILFALTALYGWTCHQMDVTTAFLNGDLLEEVYLLPPQGYPEKQGSVLLLMKALYGLKQAPRQWYKRLREYMKKNYWVVCPYDECVFISKERQLVITVYVDDLNIFGPSQSEIMKFKKEISAEFKMTDAGEASFYLGMQVEYTKEGVAIHQATYAKQILNRFELAAIKPVTIPFDPATKLLAEKQADATKEFRHQYLSKIGSINHLQTKTRIDLSFPVSATSRFMKNPNQTHIESKIVSMLIWQEILKWDFIIKRQGTNNYKGSLTATGEEFSPGNQGLDGYIR